MEQDKFKIILDKVYVILSEKNKRYGDSALSPLSIFGKHIAHEEKQSTQSILVRLDDKLSRIKNSEVLRENDVIDSLGYHILLAIDKGWSLDNLID